MSWGEGLIRLSAWRPPPGGQGQPYGDDVVAAARALVEGTRLGQKKIAARLGVSHMSVSRWARAGGWRRPWGAAKPFDETGSSPRALARFDARTRPWRLLEEAEELLAAASAEGDPGLDRTERALELLATARALHRRGVGPKRPHGRKRTTKRVARVSAAPSPIAPPTAPPARVGPKVGQSGLPVPLPVWSPPSAAGKGGTGGASGASGRAAEARPWAAGRFGERR